MQDGGGFSASGDTGHANIAIQFNAVDDTLLFGGRGFEGSVLHMRRIYVLGVTVGTGSVHFLQSELKRKKSLEQSNEYKGGRVNCVVIIVVVRIKNEVN